MTKPKKASPATPVRTVRMVYRIFERTEEGRLVYARDDHDFSVYWRWESFESVEEALDAIKQEERIAGRDLIIVPVASVNTHLAYE